MIKVRMESEDEVGTLKNKTNSPDVSNSSTSTMTKVIGFGVVFIVIGLIGLALSCNSNWFSGCSNAARNNVQASSDIKKEISSSQSPTYIYPQPKVYYELSDLRTQCNNLLATPSNGINMKYHNAWNAMDFLMEPLLESTARKLHAEFFKIIDEALEKQGYY